MVLGDTLALRVAARYLRAKSFGDPKVLIARFQVTLDKYLLPEKDLREAKELFKGITEEDRSNPEHMAARSLAYKASRNVTNGSPELADIGDTLFLAILQSYSLQPALRKKIEAAAKSYSKAYRPRRKAKTLRPFTLSTSSNTRPTSMPLSSTWLPQEKPSKRARRTRRCHPKTPLRPPR